MTKSDLTRRAAIASIISALFLLILKSWAAWTTGSVAMLGSLADTGLDLIASAVTLIGVRYAAMPADHDHRFGHGKAEALVALFQVIIITISACAIGYQAFSRMMHGSVTANADYGIGVSIIAIISTAALISYQHYVVRKTGSVAIQADHIHYQSDLLLNIAVIAALVMEQYLHILGADPIFGIAIALWLFWGAWRASSHAIDQLMDREWSSEKRQKLTDILLTYDGPARIHDLRTRTSGTRDFVQFHIWVSPKITIVETHKIMDDIEDVITAHFPDVEILIHPDPEGQIDRRGQPDELLRETPICS